jgi:hypothetical protein
MVLISAAVAAALDKPVIALASGIYSYGDTLQLDVNKIGGKAPTLVSDVLAQMIQDEPEIGVTDCNNVPLNNDEFPSEKTTFDSCFGVTTKNGRLLCSIGIRSTRTFHRIKLGVWQLLINKVWQLLINNNLWLDRKPGPITKQHLVPMGFWLNVHPGFASPRAFFKSSSARTSKPIIIKRLFSPNATFRRYTLLRRCISALENLNATTLVPPLLRTACACTALPTTWNAQPL